VTSPAAGWLSVGTPAVEIELTHSCETAAMLSTPPLVVADGLGRSAPTSDRNVGVPDDPLGAAKTVLAVSLDSVTESVPLVVIGLPPTEKPEGIDNATLVTVPAPAPHGDPDPLSTPALLAVTHCVDPVMFVVRFPRIVTVWYVGLPYVWACAAALSARANPTAARNVLTIVAPRRH
jgi:hypothetical protein